MADFLFVSFYLFMAKFFLHIFTILGTELFFLFIRFVHLHVDRTIQYSLYKYFLVFSLHNCYIASGKIWIKAFSCSNSCVKKSSCVNVSLKYVRLGDTLSVLSLSLKNSVSSVSYFPYESRQHLFKTSFMKAENSLDLIKMSFMLLIDKAKVKQ